MFLLTIESEVANSYAGDTSIRKLKKEELILLDQKCIECDFVHVFPTLSTRAKKNTDPLYLTEWLEIRENILECNSFLRWTGKKLMVCVIYRAKNILTDRALCRLLEFTRLQLSEGIGQSFSQHPVMLTGKDLLEQVYVDPSFTDEITTTWTALKPKRGRPKKVVKQ